MPTPKIEYGPVSEKQRQAMLDWTASLDFDRMVAKPLARASLWGYSSNGFGWRE